MFEIGFCAPEAGMKWKREEFEEKKSVLDLKEMDLKQITFLIWNCLLLFLFFPISTWLLILTMLSSENCL